MDTNPSSPSETSQTGDRGSESRSEGPLTSLVTYLRANPVAGLQAPLSGAPTSTWALVPGFVIVTLTLGLWTDQLEPGLPSLWRVLVLPVVLIFYPSLVEEFFYRGILLPRSLLAASRRRRFAAISASTAVYVCAHPISPLLGLSDSRFFLDPWMLLIVAALGYTLGYSYLRSGSLRAPVLIHWATVVAWNLFFGGVYS